MIYYINAILTILHYFLLIINVLLCANPHFKFTIGRFYNFLKRNIKKFRIIVTELVSYNPLAKGGQRRV